MLRNAVNLQGSFFGEELLGAVLCDCDNVLPRIQSNGKRSHHCFQIVAGGSRRVDRRVGEVWEDYKEQQLGTSRSLEKESWS